VKERGTYWWWEWWVKTVRCGRSMNRQVRDRGTGIRLTERTRKLIPETEAFVCLQQSLGQAWSHSRHSSPSLPMQTAAAMSHSLLTGCGLQRNRCFATRLWCHIRPLLLTTAQPGMVGNWTTRGLDKSRTGQLAVSQMPPKERKLSTQSPVVSASCPVTEWLTTGRRYGDWREPRARATL